MSSAPSRIERQETAAGSMEIALGAPDPRLRHLATEYQGYAEHGGPATRRLEVPIPNAVLIIGTGNPIAVAESGRPEDLEGGHRGFLAGLTESPALVESDGGQAGVQVNLTPLGARQVFGIPMHELTGRVLHLRDVLGPEGDALVDRVREAPGWDERFALVDAFFEQRMAANAPPAEDMAWAWSQLERTSGNVNIGWLADQVGWSHKHFIDRFRDAVGLSPRVAARIIRFRRACRMAQRPGRVDWAAIAIEAGYYDQAHLVREFRSFAQCTPREFLARELPDGGTDGGPAGGATNG